MNRLRNVFYSDISNLAKQIQNLNGLLNHPDSCNIVSQAECDNLTETWAKIDSNAGLTDFISWREYRDLKAAKDQLVEEITTLLEYRSFEEHLLCEFEADLEDENPGDGKNAKDDDKEPGKIAWTYQTK